MTILRNLFIMFYLILVAACGGGGGESNPSPTPSQSKTLTIKLATSGTPSSQLAGIGVTLLLPDGVTPQLANDGSVTTGVVTISGVAAPGGILTPVYTPASGNNKGTIKVAVAAQTPSGFGAGEFATVSLQFTSTNPIASDFTLSEFSPIDVKGNQASGLTVAVSSVTASL